MLDHRVYFVDDADMPAGHDFVFTHADDDMMTVYLRRSAVCERVLEEAWDASQLLGQASEVSLRSVS